MNNIGHNNPPFDPREAIEENINRKKPILDEIKKQNEQIKILIN